MSAYDITEGQARFFRDFGFLVLRGRLADDLAWIEEQFEAVFNEVTPRKAHSSPRQIAPFIDRSEKLMTLLDHPSTTAVAEALLGPEWNYLNGDGNLYAGETPWHRDGVWEHGEFIKVAMYLDPVDGDSGALRVVPGSHRTAAPLQDIWLWPMEPAEYGVAPQEIPSVPLVSNPGDVVVFSHRILHSSFGGGERRRMFTMNLARKATTPQELNDLRAFIALMVNTGGDQMHGDRMRQDAPPERMRRLEQVIENEGLLRSLARERRAQPRVSGVV